MKKRIRKTGEIVDVTSWYNLMGAERDKNDSVAYIDSKGDEYVRVEGLNLALDFEDVEDAPNKDIDWEQVRINAAISSLQGFASNSHEKCVDADTGTLARWSVGAADALIAELKKGGEK